MEVSLFDIAQRFIGLREVRGVHDSPVVMAMLQLDQKWPSHDEVPWCSAFVNFVCWLLNVKRTCDLRARSWLKYGKPIRLEHAIAGYDIVILSRGEHAPGPEIIDAPGHVGFFAGTEGDQVILLGGNQGDQVSLAHFPKERVLGVRSLLWPRG